MLKAWKIWYGDGKSFSSKEIRWEDAPTTNVQVVSFTVTKSKGIRRYNYRGVDYYWMQNNMIYKGNNSPENILHIKKGKKLPDGEFEFLLALAKFSGVD